MKTKLDGLIANNVECEIAFDHIYAVFEVSECIVYYVTGFMCRKLQNMTSCTACKNGLTESGKISELPEAELVNCKTRGGVVHPTKSIFSLLLYTAAEFQKKL